MQPIGLSPRSVLENGVAVPWGACGCPPICDTGRIEIFLGACNWLSLTRDIGSLVFSGA
jgi:hypothetical protein